MKKKKTKKDKRWKYINKWINNERKGKKKVVVNLEEKGQA